MQFVIPEAIKDPLAIKRYLSYVLHPPIEILSPARPKESRNSLYLHDLTMHKENDKSAENRSFVVLCLQMEKTMVLYRAFMP